MTAALIFGENRLCIDNFRHYAEHTLTFTFTADQTALPPFCAALDGLLRASDKL